MPDARNNLAALIYNDQHDPDAVLRDFAATVQARGLRVVGMVQAGQCADSSLSAVLLHTGETLLLAQDADPAAQGCRLDLGRLENAGQRVADALDDGADLVIINRYGKRERNGRGLLFVIERALNADIPVVIAVPHDRVTEWSEFAGPMSRTLACDTEALAAWWQTRAAAAPRADAPMFEGRAATS